MPVAYCQDCTIFIIQARVSNFITDTIVRDSRWVYMEITCERTLEGHRGYVLTLALGHDGTTLYSGSIDGTIKVWKLPEGTCERTLEGHMGSVWALALGHDGTTLYSGSDDRTIKGWKLPEGQGGSASAAAAPHGGPYHAAKTSANNLLASDDQDLLDRVGKWLHAHAARHAADARDNQQRTEELMRRLAESEAHANREKERADEAVRALARMKGEPGALENANMEALRELSRDVVEGVRRVTEVMANREDTERMCVVCKITPRDTLLVPCNHLVACQECAQNVSECPICRKRIERRTRVHT